MINLKSLSHNEFNFLFCFFVVLSSIQETSESTEFGIKKFDKYFPDSNLNFEEQIIKFKDSFNLRYDLISKIVKLKTNDLHSVRKYLVDNIDAIVSNRITSENLGVTEEELIKELGEKYKTAPDGFKMTYVHLFGIKNYKALESLNLSKISFKATGQKFLYVEINKGMKLSKFVSIKSAV